ncbi:extracellular solute-binding protein [Paenibacillus antri]|uniref:Extracellular solute-binding protein n=1 Tax=Paenibacillus antri TaxID=2582848 RepID=A0A5R9G4X4_9BACL|nr:extracellular solute-binding protein [Paenibacillus antri]TLS51412.1 extracellular solute-binding protein [Paenibacillus antri]
MFLRKSSVIRDLILISAIAVLVAGCTSNDGSGEPTAPSSTSTPTSTTPSDQPSEEKMHDISFMSYSYVRFPEPESPGVQAIRDKFAANVQSQFILASDFNTKLSVVMASGDMPDVVHIQSADANYIKWAREGAFLPLDDYIQQYETFKLVPDAVWNQFRVDGKIYSIPMYSPTYMQSITIRQDWLDRLGLKVPTSYQELLEAAIAFTHNDPDGNGKNDTYGFAMAEKNTPEFSAGAYWSGGWYHKDQDGNYIPGTIGPGRREVVETLSKAYAEGAVTKDFAVLNWAQANQEFYSGKAGIFIGIPNGMEESYYMGLLEVHPDAVVTSIPYFVAPDGSQGSLLNQGYFGLTTLSSKLADDPEKVKKILTILDYGRTFFDPKDRTPDNEHFDWLMGGEGNGYDMTDGRAVVREGAESIAPVGYMFAREEWRPWAPSNEANQYSKMVYKDPRMQEFIGKIEAMEVNHNKTPYADPSRGIYSETWAQHGLELTNYLNGEITKMISGHRPVSEWDQMVQEWKDRGGADYIKEINEGIKAKQ